MRGTKIALKLWGGGKLKYHGEERAGFSTGGVVEPKNLGEAGSTWEAWPRVRLRRERWDFESRGRYGGGV